MQKKEGKYQTNDLTLLHRTKEKNTIHRKKFPKKATSVKILHILWNYRFLWIRAAIVVGPNSFALSVLTIVIESGKNAAKSAEVFNVCQHTRFFAASTVAASLIISWYPHYHFIGWFCLYIPLTQCPCVSQLIQCWVARILVLNIVSSARHSSYQSIRCDGGCIW